jgi:hypothetical protein
MTESRARGTKKERKKERKQKLQKISRVSKNVEKQNSHIYWWEWKKVQ